MLSAELDNSVLDLFNSSHHTKAEFDIRFIFLQTFAVFRHGFLFLTDTPQKVDDIDGAILLAYSCISSFPFSTEIRLFHLRVAVNSFRIFLACVANVSARVRRES